MGRKYQVDYPQVPQSRQTQSAEQQTANEQSEPRYSWIKTPIDTEQRYRDQQIPAYTSPQPDSTNTQYRGEAAVELPTPDIPQAQWIQQKETLMDQAIDNATHPALQSRPHIQDDQKESRDEKRTDVKVPEKISKPEKTAEWNRIAPDENPLSPRLPPTLHEQGRRTTNMSVLPPATSNYVINSYQPMAQPVRGGSWQHSLCSCAEPSTCMTGLFCPCILYGKVQYRLSLRSEKKDATNMLGYNSVNGSCVAWSILCGINGIMTGLQKSRIRRSYEMTEDSGNCFSDCLEGCCCCCCVLAQNEKELRYREEESRKAATAPQTGYIPPGGMTFSSQTTT